VKPRLSFTRRDFLKLLALLPVAAMAKMAGRALPASAGDSHGAIVIVLDALSALNMSLYGYPRNTTPNIERFAKRSTVYHAHYSTANFTSSGTASLLTGTYPWTHRAFHYEGLVAEEKVDFNLFRYWGESSHRLGYTQNTWADLLLYQFSPWLDEHIDLRAFNIEKSPFYTDLFHADPIAAHKSVDSVALELEPGVSATPALALLRKALLHRGKQAADRKYAAEYPNGIPQTLNDVNTYFLLEDVFDGVKKLTASLPPSALAYLHLFPPHYPFAPRREFVDAFEDGWQPPVKPAAYFESPVSEEREAAVRSSLGQYDSYIATVDEDFGNLFGFMEREGILDHNYVILTSDHGEVYERGVRGHTNQYLYEPLIRVPLIISSPGQTSRVDVRTPTSSVDLAPTLLALTGRPVPTECEGVLLPGLGGEEDAQRSIFAIDTKSSHVRAPIRNATISLRRGAYKLIGYLGYEGMEDGYELFDLQNDPGEMVNLAASRPEIFSDLQKEMGDKLCEVNA